MAFGPEMEVFVRVCIAALLGGIIGLERELMKKPAGLRTHTLVGASAALLLSSGFFLVERFSSAFPDVITPDPFRVIEAIIVGISFLGAGVILQPKESGTPRNLTTAASILLVAGIGIAVALSAYYLAGAITLLGLVINFGLGKVEEKMLDKDPKKD